MIKRALSYCKCNDLWRARRFNDDFVMNKGNIYHQFYNGPVNSDQY